MTRHLRSSFPLFVVALLGLVFTGCPTSGPTPPPPAGGGTGGTVTPAAPLTAGEKAPIQVTLAPEAAPGEIPEVAMTATDRESCKIFVGDAMPEAEVVDLSGQRRPLRSLFGPKATVVLFWSLGDSAFTAMAADVLLSDMQNDVAAAFAEQGVSVVAINESDPVDVVRQKADSIKPSYPIVTDPGGALLFQIATAHMPRVYVVDADGRVLWFDIEYGETTREELLETLRFVTSGGAES